MIVRSARIIAIAGIILALAAPAAEASKGPARLQEPARQQTVLTLSHYVDGAVASPATCNGGGKRQRAHGVFLLPTLSFHPGNVTFTCRIRPGNVLLDLGGIVATEDASGDTYTTVDGDVLHFVRADLERICDDLLPQLTTQAPATIDGKSITGRQVSTAVIDSPVRPDSGHFYQDSVAVGHPGKLAASYCGWKALLRLRPGHHQIVVDLSANAGAPTTFTYNITVTRHQHNRRHW